MLLSSLQNKPVIESQTAKNLGVVCKIHTNFGRIDYLLTDSLQKIDCKRIFKISDAIMFKHDGRNYPDFKFFAISNQLVANEKGKIFGKLLDIDLSPDFNIKKLITDNKNLCNVEILSMSEDTIVFKRIKKQASTKNATKINHSTESVNIVTTLSNYNFLIGRTIQRNIMLNDGVLFSAGKKISKKDVDIAFKYGKLIDLTLYSKFYNIENFWFSYTMTNSFYDSTP